MRRICLVVAVASGGLLPISGCSGEIGTADRGAQDPTSRRSRDARLVGCYALLDPSGLPASRSLYGAADFVQLDTAVDTLSRPDRVALRLIGFDSSGARVQHRGVGEYGAPVWAADSLSDTVRLSFHNGLSGTTFVLTPSSPKMDTLRGWADESFDLGPTSERYSPVHAIRRSCSGLGKNAS